MRITLLKDFSSKGFHFRIVQGKVIEAWDNHVTPLKQGIDYLAEDTEGPDDIYIRYTAPKTLPKEEDPKLGEILN